MNARLDAALVEVPELAEVEIGLRQAYAELRRADRAGLAQRVHGDLHLGQVLRTSHRWVVLDFEGEPAKSIIDRQSLDSPMRDVAGMLRSFDYAARHQLIDIGSTAAVGVPGQRVGRTQPGRVLRPATPRRGGTDPAEVRAVLLRAFEADKAVYEAVYEARNRPNWLPIPLASLHRLAEQTAAISDADRTNAERRRMREATAAARRPDGDRPTNPPSDATADRAGQSCRPSHVRQLPTRRAGGAEHARGRPSAGRTRSPGRRRPRPPALDPGRAPDRSGPDRDPHPAPGRRRGQRGDQGQAVPAGSAAPRAACSAR